MTRDAADEPGEESRRDMARGSRRDTPSKSRRDALRTLGIGAVGLGCLGAAPVLGGGPEAAKQRRWPAQAAPNGTNATTNATDSTNATGGAGESDRPATTVVLGGETDGWLGLAPDPIQGMRNPALSIQAGESTRVVWVNLDGERHQFQVLDGADETLAETEPAGTVGSTRAVTFEASAAMAAYRCRFHPEQMRGTVDVATASPTDGEVVEVAVGPEGDYFRFVPEDVTVPVGGTVRWTAESVGHNVSGRPDDSDAVRLPAGAEPFSSYAPGESFAIIEVGASYEHTFTVPGEYVYVCLPHVSEGMVGTVRVTE